MVASSGRVNPKSFAIAGQRDLIGQQLAYVDMDMALRPLLRRIERDAPILTPEFAGLSDGRRPIGRPLLRSHLEQLLRVISMEARQRKPAVRLVGAGIAHENEGHIHRVLLDLFAKRA